MLGVPVVVTDSAPCAHGGQPSFLKTPFVLSMKVTKDVGAFLCTYSPLGAQEDSAADTLDGEHFCGLGACVKKRSTVPGMVYWHCLIGAHTRRKSKHQLLLEANRIRGSRS